MPKHRDSQRFDVIWQHVITSLQSGARLPRPEESQAAARAGTKIDISTLASAPDQINDISLDGGRYIHMTDVLDRIQQLIYSYNRLQRFNRMTKLLHIQDSHLL